MFANRAHINLMPTELFVRRPLLWLQMASKKRVTLTCSPNFGYRHFLKVLGGRSLENVDLSCDPRDLQRRRADLGAALQRVHADARLHRAQHQRDVSGVRPGGSLSRGRVSGARTRITAGSAPTGTSSAWAPASRSIPPMRAMSSN